MPPIRDLAHDLGMHPNWESNLHPLDGCLRQCSTNRATPARARVYYSYSTILHKAMPTIRPGWQTAKTEFTVLKYLHQTSNKGTGSSFFQKLSSCSQEEQRLKKSCQCCFIPRQKQANPQWSFHRGCSNPPKTVSVDLQVTLSCLKGKNYWIPGPLLIF